MVTVVPDVRDGLGHAVEEHLNRVSIEAPHDLPIARSAARGALALAGELGLGPFVGPVLADAKPRMLLRFRGGARRGWPEEDVVLKVYGDTPRGEGPLQSRWRARGVRTVPLVHGRAGPCTWLLMPYLRLRDCRPTRLADWLAVTDALAVQAPTMHEPAADLTEVLRPLDAVALPRLRGAVAALVRAGYQAPEGWQERAVEAYRPTGSPLHGDLALANVGLNPCGGLVVYDASALLGPRSLDAVRWAARATSAAVPLEVVLARWAQHEPLPKGNLLGHLLVVECLLEAGSRCVIAERRRALRPDVAALLRTAARPAAADPSGDV